MNTTSEYRAFVRRVYPSAFAKTHNNNPVAPRDSKPQRWIVLSQASFGGEIIGLGDSEEAAWLDAVNLIQQSEAAS